MTLSRARLALQDGFTLIEVMIAMLVTLIAMGALAAGFARNSDSALAGQRQATAVAIAQRRMEQIHSTVTRYGFDALALTSSPPSHSGAIAASPADPNDFVTTAGNYLIETNYNDTSQGEISSVPAAGEPLVVDATNGKLVTTSTITVGGVTGTVNTYVTQATLPCNSGSGATGLGLPCAANDGKRVVVAVRLNNPGSAKNIGVNTPTYLTSIFSNPVPSNQPSSSIGLRVGLNVG
jgi:prepilin-type N-terminal cleavage/methylation domain-containing protein